MIDHSAKAKQRIITQYKESNLVDYILELVAEANALEQVFEDIINTKDIDTASGEQLDVIGILVGQSREIFDLGILKFFGFNGHAQADSFGDTADPGIGARFLSEGESTTGSIELLDSEYRIFLKAKIVSNNTDATIDSIQSSIEFLFNVDSVYAQTTAGGIVSILFGRTLTDTEIAILTNTDIIPRPAGVRYEYSYASPVTAFGFQGAPGAKGFGTGIFATLI